MSVAERERELSIGGRSPLYVEIIKRR